jgi:tRNA(fMet)-specific endonuclease VapC
VRWLLDTDTCIALIKGRSERAARRLRARTVGQVGISSITFGELAYGAARSARPEQNLSALQEFMLPLEVAAFDEAAGSTYGSVRAGLTAAGTSIGPLDTLIAAHALALDVVLVTHNTREFARVAGLRLDDWIGD